MCIHDVYILGESDSFEIKLREEITANLELKRAPPCYHTFFTGRALYRNWPIKNAAVMVLDENCVPLYSSITNEKGIFKFRNIIKPGKYKVIASGMGYNTTEMATVFICENEVTKMIFSLKKNPVFANGIVYGKVLETGSGKFIEDANIYLKSVRWDKTIYKTMSNENGQYLIYNIIPNHYEMVVQKQGYMVTEPLSLIIERCSQVCLYFDLIGNPYDCKNTISGVITCDASPLSKVAVFLYLIEMKGFERIVQMQETNENGLFLFSNVEKGHYLVKGKLQNNVVYEKPFIIK